MSKNFQGEDREAPRCSDSLAALSNSYARSYYKRAVECSPSLSKLDPRFPSWLAECDIRYSSWAVRSVSEERATFKLFQTVIWLEGGNHDWHDSKFRRGLARRLEVVARMVELIPQASHGIAPGVRRDLVKIGNAKAQAIRELELLVITPESLTIADLFDRLTRDLYTLADGRWYEMPDGQEGAWIRSRWLQVLQTAGPILIIGFAIFLATLAPKGGFIYSAAAAVLLSVRAVLLNKSGISTGSIGDVLGRSEG